MFVLAMVSELQIKAGTIPGETSQQYWERWRESESNGGGVKERKQLKKMCAEKGGKSDAEQA